MKFIKIYIFLILLSANIIYADNSIFNNFNTLSSPELKVPKKNYKELISLLESTPNGLFSLYLAVIYTNGINEPDKEGNIIKKNKEKALFFYNKAIELDNFNAAQILGSLYIYHEDFNKEQDAVIKAKKYLNLALENKLYESTIILGEIYLKITPDYKKAVHYLEIGAKNNIPTAQLMLGLLYNFGIEKSKINDFELKKDKYIADMLLTKACTNIKATKLVKDYCNSKFIIKRK
jgi:TPR repeat protein